MPRGTNSNTKRVLWKEPPASVRPGRTSKWAPLLDELRANPGEWGVLDEAAPRASLVTQLNKGRIAGTYEGEFQATSRTNEPDEDGTVTFTIFAQATGE